MEGLGRAQLGRPGAIERVAGRALGRLDRRQGRLERALRLGQPRAGVGDDRLGQAEPLGDREGLAAARQADRQPVRRRQRLEVELDRGVARPRRRVGVRLQLGVMGRRRDERAGPDEVVEEGLGERRALGRVGPGPELVEQDQRPGPGRLDDPDDRAQVARERRQRLGDRLLVADVGEDVAPDRQPAAGRRRDVQPGLVHQAEQAERPQGDGLAAGVRPGHDERGVAIAEPDVDRHDATGQARMAGRQQDDLGPVGRLGAGRVHLGRERRLGRPQVEPGERVERRAQRLGVGRHERRQLVEDPRDLLRLGHLRLAPGVAELDRDQRLDEQGLAAARRVVDDALDPAARLGLDRDDVAPVAQRDDRLLERAPELGADERVEPSAQPVVGDPDGRPQPAEPRRGRVEQLPDRVEAAGQRRAQGRQRVQVARQLAQERPAVVGEDRRQPRGRVERIGDLEELGGFQPAARTARSIAGPMSRAAPIPMPGRSSSRARAWSVSSSPRATMTGSPDGSRASASRRDGPNDVAAASRARTAGNSRRTSER